MPTAGQPALYKPEYIELTHNYCLLGATNEVLGDFFGVASRTVDNCISAHLDFADAVRRGRAVADARVVRALFDRACGFSHHVSRTTLWSKRSPTRSYPPDTQLCALCCFTGPKRYFSVAMAPENSVGRL